LFLLEEEYFDDAPHLQEAVEYTITSIRWVGSRTEVLHGYLPLLPHNALNAFHAVQSLLVQLHVYENGTVVEVVVEDQFYVYIHPRYKIH
jgi:hypothetical protein